MRQKTIKKKKIHLYMKYTLNILRYKQKSIQEKISKLSVQFTLIKNVNAI